jgi:plasmid stabilization system protein ParE
MLPTYRVILMPEAFDDVNRIVTYVQDDSPQNAAHLIDLLSAATASLASLPFRFTVRHSRKDPALTVRAMPVPPFILYYRIDERTHTVRVITIRHGAQRQPRRFK